MLKSRTREALIATALIETPRPPCDKGPCPKRERCAAKMLACEQYLAYIGKNGRAKKVPPEQRRPTRAMYLEAYPKDDDDRVGERRGGRRNKEVAA